MFNRIKRLLKGKKKALSGGKAENIGVLAVFSDVLTQNLTMISGRPLTPVLRRLSPGSLETLGELDREGLFYNSFGASDAYSFSYFLPQGSFDTLKETFAHIHGELKDNLTPLRVCSWLDGNLSRLFFLQPEERPEAGSPWRVYPFFCLPKSYSPEEKDETLWRFSGNVLFRCKAGDVTFYLLGDAARLAEIEKRLNTSGTFREAVKGEVMLRYTGGEAVFFDRETTIRLRILQDKEFILGRLFIPPHPVLEGRRCRAVYRSILAAYRPEVETGEDVTRFRLSFNFGDQVYEWYYSFKMTGLEDDRQRLKAVVTGASKALKRVMNIHGVRGNFLNPNIYPDLSDHVCLEADILCGKTVARCRVFVDSAFLGTLARLMLPPWEVEYLKRNLFVRLLSVISLNQTLFRKNIHSFYRPGGLSETKEGAEQPAVIRISELLNLTPPEDFRLIVQNFFLARGWPINSLQCLFFFEHSPKEGEPPRIYTDGSFDLPRFLSALPKVKRDEWNRSLSASLNWAELSERNLRAMMDLYEAMEEDRVVLSFRTRFLLKNEFKHRVEDDYASAIAKVTDDRRYIDRLSDMPPALAQGLLSRYPLDRLALALLPDSSDRVVLDTFISGKKKALLDEEIAFRQEAYRRGTVKSREIFEAMEELRETVEKEFGLWLKDQEES
ncbi:MAG: hypothetical protein JW760_11850 [Spirochaetales bacterium]|nr:hypothetical protein [Spirochaetales bacterium]